MPAVDPDRDPSAELTVEDPARRRDDPQLVIVALLRNAPGHHDRRPVPGDVGLDPAHVEGFARLTDGDAGPLEHMGSIGGSQLMEVPDADDRHGHVAVLLRGVADEQPLP